MKVLMISIDKGLLGKNPLGDVITRHAEYGKQVERLDIVVFSGVGFDSFKISGNVEAHPTNSNSKVWYLQDAFKLVKKLYASNGSYDLVVTQDPFLTGLVGSWAKKSFGSKLLVHLHGDYPVFFAKHIISKADAVRVMSNGQKDKLVAAGVPKQKVNVISTPVDIARFENFPAVDPAFKESEEKVILMIGRLDPVKDFPTLFKAINLVYEVDQNIALWLVGNYRPQQQAELALPKGLEVKLFPAVDTKDLPAYYYAAEMLVLSSRSESFGKVLVEAGACGKPVVSTATIGAKEIIQDGYNGYLVPIGDHAALANKILHLLRNEKEAELMGEHGRQLVNEKFSDNLNKIINLWKAVVSR